MFLYKQSLLRGGTMSTIVHQRRENIYQQEAGMVPVHFELPKRLPDRD